MPRKALGAVRAGSSDAGKHRIYNSLRMLVSQRRQPQQKALIEAAVAVHRSCTPTWRVLSCPRPIGTGGMFPHVLGCCYSHPLRLKMMKRIEARMMMMTVEAMKPLVLSKPG